MSDTDQSSMASTALDKRAAALGLRISDSNAVTWRSDSPDHPRNWSAKRKFLDIVILSTLEFYTTVISTTGPSAASAAREDYGLNPIPALIVFSLLYQVGQALGALVVPPYSDSFGRRTPYIISSSAFAIFCLLIAAVPSPAMAGIGRFATGFASSVPSVVLAGSVEDLFNSRWRVWLVLLWNTLATAGLVFGPIYGVYVSEAAGWRWIYYSSAIVTALITVLLFNIRESRPSLLLRQKVKTLRNEFPDPFTYDDHDAVPNRKVLVRNILVRPAKLLVTEPLVILITAVFSTSTGIIYLFTESLTGIYMSMGLSKTTSSLPFLAIGLGTLFSIFPRIYDMKIAKKRRQNHEPLQPEDKLTGFKIAIPCLAGGLWWFAWTIPPFTHGIPWIVPTIPLAFIGFAANEIAYTLSGYISDAYTIYAASAFASMVCVRALVSGLVPLLASAMYGHLSANVATSIIAATATVFVSAPFILHRYSRSIRLRSQFAKYSVEVHSGMRVEDD